MIDRVRRLFLVAALSLIVVGTNSTMFVNIALSLDYKADTSQIRAKLQSRGYNVHKVGFEKNKNDKYCVSVYIDTKGNYDKESLVMHRIMFNNAIADYYFAMIVDYELQASWSFRASRQTLSDYFSGKIREQEYIHQVKTEKIM